MTSIYFDKHEYKAGEIARITYVDALANSLGAIRRGGLIIHRKVLVSGGSGSFEYAIPTTLGKYEVVLLVEGRVRAHDTMHVVSDGAPTPPSDGGEEVKLSPGQHEIKWTLSNYDTLTSTIEVTKTGVICISVNGVCYSTTPPGVAISGFSVTGHLKPSGVAPPTTFSGWVASKGGKDAIAYADALEIGDAYIGLADVGFTVTYSHVLTCGDYYLGLG